jgi:hypothetical protein
MRTPKITIIFLAALLLIACASAAKDGFEYLGEWSNVVVSQGEDPHAYGYSLTLWKHNGQLVGFLSEYVGPTADAPIGPLQDLTFDSDSGKLSFSAKMTTGVTFSAGHKDGAPSRTLYKFSGVLSKSEVMGTLVTEDHLDNTAPTQLELGLKAQTNPNQVSSWNQKTFQEWEQFYAPILRARGPKW